jgi:imidazolonepropionase-like amidohydrolase
MLALRLAKLAIPAAIAASTMSGRVPGPAAALPGVVVVRGATLIDGTGRPPVRDAVVVIRDGRITDVGPSARVRTPSGARVVDAAGGFLLPGFIDAHAHVPFGPVRSDPKTILRFIYDADASRQMASTLLDFGVTTARSPGGPAEQAVALRDSIRAGRARGPRLVVAGDIIDVVATGGLTRAATNEAEIRAEVDRQATIGVDLIKLYNFLSPDLVRAAIDQAHRRGLRAIGHLMATNWREAAEAGIDGLVHITPLSPSLIDATRRKAFLASIRSTRFMFDWFDAADLDGPLITAAIDALQKRNIVVDPTLVIFEAMARGDDLAITASPDLTYTPKAIVDGWRDFQLTSGWTPEDFAAARKVWPRVEALVRKLRDRGVPLAVGSDTPNPWVPPGASLHREMELLVAAGLTPMEVLVAATRNGARACGLEAEVGTVEVGKRADLVLLAADPLQRISNTRTIRWVMQNGVTVAAHRRK